MLVTMTEGSSWEIFRGLARDAVITENSPTQRPAGSLSRNIAVGHGELQGVQRAERTGYIWVLGRRGF